MVGTILEFYDFTVYGTVAALVFGHLFFPSNTPVAGVLATFATFAVGFFARPLGSVLFGHFGDRLGRKNMLVISMLGIGLSTFVIGLLPPYAAIGVWAPVFLVVLRIIQGISVGGEWGGAALLLVENSSHKRKGVMGSVSQMGGPSGLLLATGITSLAILASGDQFEVWGWRIPFLMGGLIVAVGLWLRIGIAETPEFERMQREQANRPENNKVPALRVFKENWKAIVLAFGIGIPGNGVFFTVATYTLSFGPTELKLDRTLLLNTLTVVAVIEFIMIPVFGWVADKTSPRLVLICGAVGAGVFALTYFPLLATGSPALIFLAMGLSVGVVHAALQAPMAALFSSRFDVSVRYTGVALSQVFPPTIVGGTIPFIAALLFSNTGSTVLFSGYLLFLALCGVVCSAIRLKTDGQYDPAPVLDTSAA
jgi:MFS family permease